MFFRHDHPTLDQFGNPALHAWVNGEFETMSQTRGPVKGPIPFGKPFIWLAFDLCGTIIKGDDVRLSIRCDACYYADKFTYSISSISEEYSSDVAKNTGYDNIQSINSIEMIERHPFG